MYSASNCYGSYICHFVSVHWMCKTESNVDAVGTRQIDSPCDWWPPRLVIVHAVATWHNPLVCCSVTAQQTDRGMSHEFSHHSTLEQLFLYPDKPFTLSLLSTLMSPSFFISLWLVSVFAASLIHRHRAYADCLQVAVISDEEVGWNMVVVSYTQSLHIYNTGCSAQCSYLCECLKMY